MHVWQRRKMTRNHRPSPHILLILILLPTTTPHLLVPLCLRNPLMHRKLAHPLRKVHVRPALTRTLQLLPVHPLRLQGDHHVHPVDTAPPCNLRILLGLPRELQHVPYKQVLEHVQRRGLDGIDVLGTQELGDHQPGHLPRVVFLPTVPVTSGGRHQISKWGGNLSQFIFSD